MKTTMAPQIITAGTIAAALRQPLHRVTHILRTRPHIQPAAMAGKVRLYKANAVAQVRYELNLIDAKRCDRGGAS